MLVSSVIVAISEMALRLPPERRGRADKKRKNNSQMRRPYGPPRSERRGCESVSMSDEPKSLHVNPVGENWEVESETATLGQADSKPEAVELAKELAAEQEAAMIAVHTPDGQ